MIQHGSDNTVELAEMNELVPYLESDPRASGSRSGSVSEWSSVGGEVAGDLLAKAVRLHADLVPRQAFRLTRDVHDAEDLSQDVFVQVLRALPRFDPSVGSMEGWLYRITMNLFRDRVRKDRLRRPRSLYDAAEPACRRPGPAELALARHLDPHLEAALWSLPSAMLDTVLLADVAGLSHRDIAAMTGVARGTVASRLCRAHARLQTYLTEQSSPPLTLSATTGAHAELWQMPPTTTDEEYRDVSVHCRLRRPPS